MIKHIFLAFLTALSLTIANTQALPIEDADAFVAGDHHAAYDPNTGITWMDFGVNNARSLNSVIDALNDAYLGWRLPTEKEVRDLWGQLEQDIKENNYGIFSLFGANKVPSKDLLPYYGQGYFIDDLGYIGYASLMESGTIINELRSEKYYSDGIVTSNVTTDKGLKYDRNFFFFNQFGNAEQSTLLVRTANVSEPSSFILLIMGLLSLGIFRRKLRQ